MAIDLGSRLVIGISSRALFDLERENQIFELDGVEAYRAFQREHEQIVLQPGAAFPIVRALLKLNNLAPTDQPLAHKSWQKPHQENLTGTALAYAPSGSLRAADPKPRADYEAWSPE